MSSAVVSQVHEHMTPRVVSVTEAAPLEEVLKTLRQRDISCVLVTDASGAPSGVVSLTDLARVSKLEGGHHGPLKIMPPDRIAKEIMKAPSSPSMPTPMWPRPPRRWSITGCIGSS